MSQLPLRLRNAATHVFHYMVTPSGSKIALTARDLASYSGVSSKRVEPLLKRLAAPDIRLLRSIETGTDKEQDSSYEIFHDALAAAIIDWRLRHRRDYRKMLLGFLAGAIVGILLFLLAPTVFPRLGGMTARIGSLGPPYTGETEGVRQTMQQDRGPIGRSDPMVSVKYDETKAVAGSELRLTVTVYEASVVKISPAKNAEDLIRITAVGSSESPHDAPPGTRSYNYVIGISPQAAPRTYLFTVGLKPRQSSYVERNYPLYVSAEVKDRNYLRISPYDIRVTAGESAIVFLSVTNQFADYAVKIHRITLEPGGPEPVEIYIQPRESRELPVRVRVGAQNINQSYSDLRSLNIALAYEDEHGRSGVSQERIQVWVNPNFGLILLAALAGGIMGTAGAILFQRGFFKFSTPREQTLRKGLSARLSRHGKQSG